MKSPSNAINQTAIRHQKGNYFRRKHIINNLREIIDKLIKYGNL